MATAVTSKTTSSSGPKSGSDRAESAHAWEDTSGQQAWESAVQEDAEGNIIVSEGDSTADLIRKRRKHLEQNDYSQRNRRIVRDMIRYLYVLVDASRWVRDKDPVLPPGTRIDVVVQLLLDFVQEYYDQNPLSHLGFVIIKNGEAEILTQLSSNSKAHKLALQSITQMTAREGPNGGGEFSLQNGLEVAGRSLGHQPRHGSREIVIVCGALSTCDPGNVLDTLPRLKSANIRVSTLALASEMHVCRKLSDETGGVVGVCLDKAHLRDWLMGQCVPPPALKEQDGQERTCEMVQMGFPTRTSAEVPTLVHASRDKKLLARTAYTCPQCQAKVPELPTDCTVCGLKLVLSPHLARSFHHLFPVVPFSEVSIDFSLTNDQTATQKNDSMVTSSSGAASLLSSKIRLDSKLLVSSDDSDRSCYACLRTIGIMDEPASKTKKKGEEILRFQCPECKNLFCMDCDVFLHTSLHNCPGCLSR